MKTVTARIDEIASSTDSAMLQIKTLAGLAFQLTTEEKSDVKNFGRILLQIEMIATGQLILTTSKTILPG